MPYAPQISYQAPQFDAPRGDASNWGRALMQILGDKSAKEERLAEQAKAEAGEFKTLVAYGETLGLDKNNLMTKDLDTVRGMVKGLTAKQEFEKAGAVVIGVSRDTLKSHEGFRTKHELPFDLISDTDEKVCNQFDVIKLKNMYGKQVRGIQRSTFVIGRDGKLAKEWRGVKVPGHAQAVLDFVKSL